MIVPLYRTDRLINLTPSECEEYGKYVYTEEHSPLLHVNAGMETVSKCGIVEIPLIIGGVKATANEFPHMVGIEVLVL